METLHGGVEDAKRLSSLVIRDEEILYIIQHPWISVTGNISRDPRDEKGDL